MKKLLSLILALLMCVALLPSVTLADDTGDEPEGSIVANKSDDEPKDSGDNRYWASGDWSNGWGWWSQHQSSVQIVRVYGCLIVAMSKMLNSSGCVANDYTTFNPDIYYYWCLNNGYLQNDDISMGTYASPVYYSENSVTKLVYEGVTYGENDPKIWENINAGKYTILRSTGSSHYVFVNNSASKEAGRIRVFESWGSGDEYSSYGYDGNHFSTCPGTRDWTAGTREILTYHVNSTPSSYTVSYDANGGTGAPASQTKTAGKALTLSTVQPSRASSTAGSYTVTLNANGGKVDTASLTAGRTTNYTFKNWNTARNGSGTSYSPGGSYTTDANVTLYAQWNSSTTTAAVTLPTPYYYGYYFKGWATSSSASSGVTGSYTPSGNCTLYATWEKEDLSGWSDEKPDNIYDDLIETATEYRYADRTVTSSWTQTDSGTIDYVESWPSGFDKSHSLYSQYHNTPKTVGISGNKKIEASTASNGFIYWHWCFNNGSLSSGNYNVYISDTPYYTDEAGRYYQYFTALKSNTDAGHYDPNNRYGGEDCYYVWRDTPSDGSWWWYRIPVYRQTYTEYTGGTAYGDWSDWSCWTMIVYPTGETRKSESKTVYRYKDNIAVILTFNASGGTCSTSEKTVIPGERYGTLPTPTRTGYSFDGWYTASEGGSRVTQTTRITTRSDHSLYAHWTKTDVTVTFDPNGGSVSPTSKTVTYGSTYGDLPTPTRTGYTFNGWYTAASGGSKVTASTTVTTASDHTLYAHWTTADITVTFDPNGGSVSTDSKTVTYGSTYGTLPTPTRTGYTFDGWFTAASGGTPVTSSTTVTIAENHTLYAHWTAEIVTVYFDPNGGSISTISKDVTFGSTYGALPTPTLTGYSFDGWFTDLYGGTQVTSSTTVTNAETHTLYAHWTEEEEPAFDGTIVWNSADVQYKGSTPYVIVNGSAQTPRFSVKDRNGNTVSRSNYTYAYRENTNAGTGYVIVTFTSQYSGTTRAWFKIYLPPTTTTTVENVSNGIKLTWSPVEGAAGYVIYRRAWSSTTNGWTDFVRWYNVTGLSWIDGSDADHKVYAGTRYQYGVKAYFARRVDPVSGATIGGNVGDNYNLGEVGPLKTTVRITTRVLNSVTAGRKQLTAKWGASSVFTGYQVQCATSSAFTKNVKTIRITNPKTAQTVIKNLTSGKTYYVRVRSYHEFNGMTYFGEWSNVKTCKVK